MTFSISTIFFLTKHVDVFGSGMYFYGFNADVYPGFRMIHLKKIKVRKIQSFIWSDFFVLNVKMHTKKYLSRCQNKDDVKTIFILSNGNSEFDDVDN